jgi:hypothetical protein
MECFLWLFPLFGQEVAMFGFSGAACVFAFISHTEIVITHRGR